MLNLSNIVAQLEDQHLSCVASDNEFHDIALSDTIFRLDVKFVCKVFRKNAVDYLFKTHSPSVPDGISVRQVDLGVTTAPILPITNPREQ